ncbi:MAG: hypothetical protein IT373_30340 [Polyangiaceae bacterium]|nr:hypothetical protein [Polyangiaceae bacterium]
MASDRSPSHASRARAARHATGHTLALALALVAHAPPAARAQSPEPTARDKEAARALMKAGDGKLAAGDAAGALADFEGADRIMGVPSTREAVCRAEERLGRLLAARDTCRSVRDLGMAGTPEPPAFAEARERAAARVLELDARLASLRPEVKEPPLPQRPPAQPPASHVAPAPEPAPAAPGGVSPLAWVGLVVGVACLVTVAVAVSIATDRASAVKGLCAGTACPPEASDDLDRALVASHASTAGFVLAGAGLVATVVGFALPTDGGAAEHEAAVRLRLELSPRGLGLRGAF